VILSKGRDSESLIISHTIKKYFEKKMKRRRAGISRLKLKVVL
jgi:hypothetical protein